MSSKLASCALAAFMLIMFGASAAHAQSTTRIESRPFYGATVTLEEGVRVFRALPAERHVIINPDNATPLALSFNETKIYDNRVVRNYISTTSGSTRSVYAGRIGNHVAGYHAVPYGLGRHVSRHRAHGVHRHHGGHR